MNQGQLDTPRKSICFLADYLDVGGRENVLADAMNVLIDDYEITLTTLYNISQEMQSKIPSEVIVNSNI